MNAAKHSLVLFLVTVAAADCSRGESKWPPLVASSKYIDYHTRGDTSVICMDDFLEREDRFIEETALALGLGVPTGRIHFISDPTQDLGRPETWSCKTATDCYWYVAEEDYGVILSAGFTHRHELVHAIEIPALGEGAHRMLGEGVAQYFGSYTSSASVLEDFSGAFKAMVTDNPQPSDYRLAMHFVGSLIGRYGVEKYKAMRSAMPSDGGLDELASAFESVYGQTLDQALAEMSDKAIHGLDPVSGCVEGEGQVILWTAPGLIETTVRGECGDGWFVSGGGQGFGTRFVIDVPEAGIYELTVGSPDGGSSAQFAGQLMACPRDTPQGFVDSYDGATGFGLLHPGRHVLSIGFPHGPEPRGSATLRLEFDAPPP